MASVEQLRKMPDLHGWLIEYIRILPYGFFFPKECSEDDSFKSLKIYEEWSDNNHMVKHRCWPDTVKWITNDKISIKMGTDKQRDFATLLFNVLIDNYSDERVQNVDLHIGFNALIFNTGFRKAFIIYYDENGRLDSPFGLDIQELEAESDNPYVHSICERIFLPDSDALTKAAIP